MVKHASHQLTQSSTPYFLRRSPKDGQHLNHNLNDHVAHGPGRWDASIYLKPAEEMSDPIEDLDKLVMAIARIFSRLRLASKWVTQRKDVGTLTDSRTPIPAKITLAGGNACKIK